MSQPHTASSRPVPLLRTKTIPGEYEEVTGALVGAVLRQRYQIGDFIDRGQFGSVYHVVDLEKGKSEGKLVIKIAPSTKNFKNEVKAMVKIQKAAKKDSQCLGSVPKVKAYGHILYRG